MDNANLKTRLFFYANLLLVAVVVGYKVYLNFFEQDFSSVHAEQLQRIESQLAGRDEYRFAVVGNINNSVGIFERKIIPRLNASGVDFVVSSGNAVLSGGEDKYRALYRTLSHLEIPYLLTFGEGEESRLGSFRFYDHFGPYFFAFHAANTEFVFLDSTGKTDYQWQLRWLEQQLRDKHQSHVLVFSGHPFHRAPEAELMFEFDEDYLFPEPYRERFQQLFSLYQVDAVFSANLPLYMEHRRRDTRYILSGGAGGFVPESEHGFYHYVEVAVAGDQLSITPQRLDIDQHPFWRTLEGLWFFIHSLFYAGYLNVLLLISSLIVVGLWLYMKVFVERDYYPNFDINPEAFEEKPLKVAQFTNNYLPFIGGVPISIDRLRQGLQRLGHQVKIVAPRYREDTGHEDDITRISTLLPLNRRGDFRLANVFSPRIYRAMIEFRPDLIHVHHPFWLGRAGWLLGQRLRVPVIYTYHTRLEHYAHYVPLPGPLFRNLVSHALIRRFANHCDGVIVPTASAEEYLRIIGVKRPIFVQPTGIEYQRFQQLDSTAVDALRQQLQLGEERVLVSISRLSKEKNIDFIIDAARLLKQQARRPFRIIIIGEGQEKARLQQRINAADLSEQVQLVGAVAPEVIPVYCALSDVFVFASRSETQGMVILEAMAAGLPVVTVRSSGIDDIVRNGVNGYKTLEDLHTWTAAVKKLLDEPAHYRQLSDNARQLASEYDIQHFSRNIARFYAQILASRQQHH